MNSRSPRSHIRIILLFRKVELMDLLMQHICSERCLKETSFPEKGAWALSDISHHEDLVVNCAHVGGLKLFEASPYFGKGLISIALCSLFL